MAGGRFGGGARAIEEDQVVAAAQGVDRLVGAHHEEHVARFDRQGFDRLAHVATFAMQGDGYQAEPLAEVYAAHGFTDELGLGQDDRLDQ